VKLCGRQARGSGGMQNCPSASRAREDRAWPPQEILSPATGKKAQSHETLVLMVGAARAGRQDRFRGRADYLRGEEARLRPSTPKHPRGTLQAFIRNQRSESIQAAADQMKDVDTLATSAINVSLIE